ncbi:MAG TPA: hypothetical protein VK897_01630 [Anaerolineales bacterium]|nr:hypothetical protein [Anaerolineales bacterium]
MAIQLLVTEDTPTKVVLQTNPEYNEDVDETHASNLQNALGCLGIFAVLLVFILYFFFATPRSALPWYFWGCSVAVLIALAVFLFFEISLLNDHRTFGRETTVTVDLLSQRALRIEKPKSGKVRKTEINLSEVSRVLIDCQEVGHLCKLVLESPNHPPFEVNSAYDFEMDPLKDLSKKIGGFLDKPVILKLAEGSKVESEEEI